MFGEALERPALERDAFVEGACAGDEPLRDEVRALLAAHAQGGRFLGAPTSSAEARSGGPDGGAPIGEGPGSRIGPYKLLQRIGEGGFGVVFMADQEAPVARRVALKIIKLGMDTRQVIARFEAERQALAMMDHPNIARVLDAGSTGTGRPYFVMELVKGEPITEFCDKHKLSTDERLDLFTQVCQAVQHAHTKGIIHRDLKPSNILVSTQDGRAHARVIDFGIAKATGARLTEKTLFTEHRALIGTPEYMSPEQAEGSLDIDTRTDVYSLGVLLYELLTGTTPFPGAELRRAAYAEMQRIIREVEPPKPSTRLSQSAETLASIAAKRHTEPRKLGALVRGDLDWIVMKALEKDRQRRYETASGLAMEIGRHLAGEPVLAVPPSAAYRVRKFVRRHRVGVAAGGVVAATLVLGLAGTTWGVFWALDERARAGVQAAEATMQAQKAEAARKEAQQIADFQAAQFQDLDVQGMGVRMRQNLLTQARAAMEQAKLERREIEARQAELERLLAGINFTTIALQQLDLDVFERALDAVEKKFADQPLVHAQLLQTLATTLLDLGLTERAAAPQERALAIRRRMLGDERRETLYSINGMARLLQAQGRLPEAEAQYREALETGRRVLGDEHPDVLALTNNLGGLLQSRGRFAEAEPLYREALEKRRRVSGDERRETLLSLHNMATLLQDQGRLREAEPYYREALEKQRRLLGVEHRDVIVSTMDLATLLRQNGEFAEAETLLRDAMSVARRTLGDEHPLTLVALSAMAALFMHQWRPDEAEPYGREALEGKRRLLGDDHPETLDAMGVIALILQDQGKLEEAEPLLREVLSRSRRVLGEEHPDTLDAKGALGLLLAYRGNLQEAEALLRENLEQRRRLLGDDHPKTLVSIHNWALLLEYENRPDEADPIYREELERARRGQPPDEYLIAGALAALGLNDLRRQQFAEAEPLLRESLEIRRRILVEPRTDVWTLYNTMSSLGEALAGQGRYADAEPLFMDGYEGLRSNADHIPGAIRARRIRAALDRIVGLYTAWDRAEPAGGFERKAAEWRARVDAVSPAPVRSR